MLLLAALAGCDDDGSEPPPDRPPRADATRDCRTHIEGRLRPFDPRTDWAAGPVRFYGFREAARYAVRHPRNYFRRQGERYGPHKFVTEVRAGPPVTVAVAAEAGDEAALVYDNEDSDFGPLMTIDQAERVVRFRACARDRPAFAPRALGRRTVGPWTQFNGGMIFTTPQCLKLDVWAGGRRRSYTEPFGLPQGRCPT